MREPVKIVHDMDYEGSHFRVASNREAARKRPRDVFVFDAPDDLWERYCAAFDTLEALHKDLEKMRDAAISARSAP
jgi:hypothetical protein